MNTSKGYIIIEEDQQIRDKHLRSMTRKTGAGLGICEQLRFVYDTVHDLDIDDSLKEKLTDQLVDAFIMAKKMQERLSYYYINFNDGTGHQGKNIKTLQNNGTRSKMRNSRSR